MKKLLNIDQNAKTVKGQVKGFLTAVLYLAPYKASGINVCPMAELAGCWKGCLNTAGRGGISKGSKRFKTPAVFQHCPSILSVDFARDSELCHPQV